MKNKILLAAFVAALVFGITSCGWLHGPWDSSGKGTSGNNGTGGSGGTGGKGGTGGSGSGSSELLTLSGEITISPSTGININTELTATYSGSEIVTYQWKEDGVNKSTGTKYTPKKAGSCSVTVSAEGYHSKTATVDVNDPSLLTLSGNISIGGGGSATVGTELTATYSGSETVTYRWEKDGTTVGTNSNKYTPTEAGSYTVTVSASGYNSKTSAAVVVSAALAEITSANGIVLRLISAGTFTMGSPASEPNRDSGETQHQVTLTKSFYMGKYQVTQEQYQAVMESNPSSFSSSPQAGETQGKRPVEMVSWYDALVFCNKLSVMEGLSPAYSISGSTDPTVWGAVPTSNDGTWNAALIVAGSTGYRLPTEAQWEYACRAGTTTAYNTGDTISDSTGWYSSNSGSKTHEVGKKSANAWGLYDMHGNVYEWCWDWYGTYPSTSQTDPMGASSGTNRVVRGQSWIHSADNLRSARRGLDNPYSGYYYIGFRLVRP